LVTWTLETGDPETLAAALGEPVGEQKHPAGGAFTRTHGRSAAAADAVISTAGLGACCVRSRDLTISVEAGIPYAELCRSWRSTGR